MQLSSSLPSIIRKRRALSADSRSLRRKKRFPWNESDIVNHAKSYPDWYGPLQHIHNQSNASADGNETVPMDTYETAIVFGITEITITNLQHFQEYSIEVIWFILLMVFNPLFKLRRGPAIFCFVCVGFQWANAFYSNRMQRIEWKHIYSHQIFVYIVVINFQIDIFPDAFSGVCLSRLFWWYGREIVQQQGDNLGQDRVQLYVFSSAVCILFSSFCFRDESRFLFLSPLLTCCLSAVLLCF